MDDAVTTPQAKGFARLAVREPEPWTPGEALHPGLIVNYEPFDASLAVLWRNELKLSVNGPEGFTVRVYLKLYAADGRLILSDRVSDSMALPITPDAWRGIFAKFLKMEDRAWKYLEAVSCALEIVGDTLGICALRFDHEPLPLRWVLTSRRRKTFMRLIDDTGLPDDTLDIQFFSMEHPLRGTSLDAKVARAEFSVEPPGGLYLAQQPPFNDSAVVSVPPNGAGLPEIGVRPDVEVGSGRPAIQEALHLLCLWFNARQAGFLANFRQRQVTDSIFNAIFNSICGANWIRAEKNFAERPSSTDFIEALRNLVDRHTRFGHSLAIQGDGDENHGAIVARFTAEAGRLRVSQDRHLCHFALRFAACQDDVLTDPLLKDSVSKLVENPALLRGARLVSLLYKCQLNGRPL